MNKKLYIFFVIALIFVFTIGFYIGKKQNKKNDFANLKNINRPNDFKTNQNNITGSIIDQNDNSITIQLKESGSKIIIISDTTEIFKTVNINTKDLKIGDNIMVSGKTNDDGTIIANNIRIVDQMPPIQKSN